MTICSPHSARIIHDIKNLLSALVLAVDALVKDKNQAALQQASLGALADLVQELIIRVDKLARAVGTDRDLRSPYPPDDKSKLLPTESNARRH